MQKVIASFAVVVLLSGCAGLQFYDLKPGTDEIGERNDYISLYETKPAALVAYGGDCSVSVTIISLPGKKRFVRLKSGYGSNKLGINFGIGGTLSSVNQETDTKVPETITAISGTVKNFADAKLFAEKTGGKGAEIKECKAHADVFDIIDGKLVNPQSFHAATVSQIVLPPPAQSAKEVAAEIIKSCKAAVAGEPTGLPPTIAAAFIRDCKDNVLK